MTRLRHGRTTILIAHRMTTVTGADKVAVIENGRVAECGRPTDLLTETGRFARSCHQWFG